MEQTVVDNVMDGKFIPVHMTYDCMQAGEERIGYDPITHKEKPVYMTFKRVSGNSVIWEYCGYCFKGENTRRAV